MDVFARAPRVLSIGNVVLVAALLCSIFSIANTQDGIKLNMCVVVPPMDTQREAQVTKICSELSDPHRNSAALCTSETAPDRLTCLRRVAQGQADFTTLEPEDLYVATRRQEADDVVVTNTLRSLAKPPFVYNVTLMVRNSANITSLEGLRNSKLCHPGFGLELEWSDFISRYLEDKVVPQHCDETLTLIENSLNSSSQFFRSACKAGHWVPDVDLDAELKSRYHNLCSLCEEPTVCSMRDKYWGYLGPLLCLTEGVGDVVWARLNNIKFMFYPEDTASVPEGDPSEYSFLCPNGTLQPVDILKDSKTQPCVWISRPWPVVVASRDKSVDVKQMMKQVARAEPDTWQSSLAKLVAPEQEYIHPASLQKSLEDRLRAAPGWLSAVTYNPCGAMGTPKLCVKSGPEASKCQWLVEAARAYGVQGAPLCVTSTNCLDAVKSGEADLTTINPDMLYSASHDYGLKVLLYELPRNKTTDMYHVSAVVTNRKLKTLRDLRGKRACFPTYNGVDWIMTLAALRAQKLIQDTCDDDVQMLHSFFSSVCVVSNSSDLGSVPLCFDDSEPEEDVELRAMACLLEGRGDVAFVSSTTKEYVEHKNSRKSDHAPDLRFACYQNSAHDCFLGWAPRGMVVTRESERGANVRQWRTMFGHLTRLFGPDHESSIPSLLMFGLFDNKSNLIFHKSTKEFVDYNMLSQEFTSSSLDFIQVLRERDTHCPTEVSSASHQQLTLMLLLLSWLMASM